MKAEGWYRDPFGLHDDRWFSDGRPTRLVRDSDVESYDDPPSGSSPAEPVPVAEGPAYSGDTKRADAAERAPQEYEIEAATQEDEVSEAFTVVDTIIDQGPIDLHALGLRTSRMVKAGAGRVARSGGGRGASTSGGQL